MSKKLQTFTILFSVILLVGFGLYTSKDPEPQNTNATTIPASMEVLKYQAPSNHDRAGLTPPLWAESFDGTTFPPAGWLNLQESGTGLWTRATTTAHPSGFAPHSGAGMGEFTSWTYTTGTISTLVSPVFSLTSGQAKLGFWMLRDAGYATTADKVDFMINTAPNSTGATLLLSINRAKTLAPVETGADGWYYYEFTIPAGFNTATNYIIMKATSQYGNDMYVDDVSVNPLLLHDVGTISVDVNTPLMPGSIVPKATVKNFGSSAETFPVTMTITPGSYTSTINVTSLAAGTTSQVTFSNWAATIGTYTVKVITQSAADLDRTNDTLTKSVTITAATWTSGNVITAGSYLGSGVGYNKPGNDTAWLFAVGGNAPNTNAIYKYNVKTNAWSSGAALPLARVVFGTAIVKDTLYAIAGSNGTTYSNTLYKYNINANTWVAGTVLPVATLGWCKAAGYQDSLIYVVAGNDGTNAVATVHVYNAISGSWRTGTPLPQACFGGGLAITGNTLVYSGGIQGAVPGSVTYEGAISQSDRSTITWTTGAVNPIGTLWKTDMAPWFASEVIMTTGTTSASSTTWWIPDTPNKCYSYNPATNTWSVKPNLTTPVLGGYLGSVSSGQYGYKLIVASGYNGTAAVTNTQIYTEDFTPVNNGNANVPDNYSLGQNYPNPFNPVTKINYDIKENGFVSMKIYSILGEEVMTIVDGYKAAGSYTVDFNASSLSSGVYIYRINTGSYTDSKKMILIK